MSESTNPESPDDEQVGAAPKPRRKPTPKPEQPHDIYLELTATPGEPLSFDVPEGVKRVTIKLDQSFLGGNPLPSAERRPGFLGQMTQGCGGLVLGCFTVLVILSLIGMLFGR